MKQTFPTDFYGEHRFPRTKPKGHIKPTARAECPELSRDNHEIADFTVAGVDHYHQYKEDIFVSRNGVKIFRFSIAWSNFSEGRGTVNQKDWIITAMSLMVLKHEFSPLWRWTTDLPQALEDEGGWTKRSTVEAFAAYAKTLFTAYGDRVTLADDQWTKYHAAGGSKILGKFHYQKNTSNFITWWSLKNMPSKRVMKSFQMAKIGPVPNISLVYAATSRPEDNQAALYFNSVRNWAYLDFACFGRYNTVFQDYLNQNGLTIDFGPEDEALMKRALPDFLPHELLHHSDSGAADGSRRYENGISDQQSEDIMERGFTKGSPRSWRKMPSIEPSIPWGWKRRCRLFMIVTTCRSSLPKTA